MFVPQADIKVEVDFSPTSNSWAGSFNQFILTTPDGIKYYFGGNSSVEESWTNVGTRFPNFSTRNSWYLTRIVSPTGRSITLEYADEWYNFSELAPEFFFSGGNNGGIHPWCNLVDQRIRAHATRGKRLTRILTSQEEINFQANTVREDLAAFRNVGGSIHDEPANLVPNGDLRWQNLPRRLDHIEIRRIDQNIRIISRGFSFQYDYFQAPAIGSANDDRYFPYYGIGVGSPPPGSSLTDQDYKIDQAKRFMQTDRKRLKLLAVQEVSPSMLNKPPYRFTYHEQDELSQPLVLPRRISFQQDHWGYYNGARNNKTLIAWDLGNNLRCVSNRSTSVRHVLAGSLKSMTYPTGGETLFELEPHGIAANPPGGYGSEG